MAETGSPPMSVPHLDARKLDGKPVVGFSISRTRGSSEVAVAAEVRAALARLNKDED